MHWEIQKRQCWKSGERHDFSQRDMFIKHSEYLLCGCYLSYFKCRL